MSAEKQEREKRDVVMEYAVVRNFRDLYRKHEFDNQKTIFSPLWHYTSGNGLLGIIRCDSSDHGRLHFWFTRSDCLNDTSEGNHILDLYITVCETLYKEHIINDEFYEIIKDLEISAHQFINYPVPSDDGVTHASILDYTPCHAFICCFSLKEDSLDMWRYYSKGDGGYGLKFSPFLFDTYKEFEYSDYDEKAVFSMIRAYKIIYDYAEKESILRELIQDAFSAYQNSSDSKEINVKNARGFISYSLKVLQFQFKHECYASEQEYRFVFYRPYSKPKHLKNELPPVKFRSHNGVIVPYIELEIENGMNFLEEVQISPYIKSDYALDTTHEYLELCGYLGKTSKSLLPVRE